jgi:hypothetical protein
MTFMDLVCSLILATVVVNTQEWNYIYSIEETKGVEYFNAWLDRHPNVSLVEKGTFLSEWANY